MPETKVELGSDVALGMIKKCDLTKGSTVAMKNFFTASAPLDKLTDIGMYGVGTIQENRLQGQPLKKKAALKNKPGEHLITHLMETIFLFPGEKTKLSSLPPTICHHIQLRQQSAS